MGESIGTRITMTLPAKWKGEDGKWPHAVQNVLDYLGGLCNKEESAPGFFHVTAEGEANYGLSGMDYDDFLDPLTKLRIPWEGQGDAKYEYEAEWMLFDGNAEGIIRVVLPSGQDGPLVMTAGTYHAINQGVHEWAKTHWEFFHRQPGLPDSAPWLLDAPHPDDEDAVDDEMAVL